jgi:hypothetical protein
MILAAMSQTKSNMASARYLNCSLQHYRKWAMLYEATEPGYKSLYHQHKNQSGKGIPKFLKNSKKEPALDKILSGDMNPSSFNPQKLKYRLISEGHLKEECGKCGFKERRVHDYKMPLLLHFKDANKQNWRKDNLEMICYNCYYLFITDVFTEKEIENLEDHKPQMGGKIDWELDDYTKQRLEELGLGDSEKDDSGDDFDIISYK